MDNNYIKALSIAEDTLYKINSIYNDSSVSSFEDIKACKATEKVIEDLEDFVRDIKHYSKPTEEGGLELNRNGRYELKGTELTCGYPIEVYNQESCEWNDGRIEHSSQYGGYYFYNYDGEHFALSDVIRARVRV